MDFYAAKTEIKEWVSTVNIQFMIVVDLYLQSQEVTLQTVSNENGFSTEHAEQHGLNISQSDGGVF